jgi:hypothetical protein
VWRSGTSDLFLEVMLKRFSTGSCAGRFVETLMSGEELKKEMEATSLLLYDIRSSQEKRRPLGKA